VSSFDRYQQPSEHAERLGQSVPAVQAAADDLRDKSAQNTPAVDDEAEKGGI